MLNLTGRTIMIVEHDYVVANELAGHCRNARAKVLGPFPTADSALSHARTADLGVLDLQLGGREVYPVADRLMDLVTPIIFCAAQETESVPRRFAHIARYQAQQLAAMFDQRMQEQTIAALLPRLRLSAGLILQDALAADRLVEATLELAAKESPALDEFPSLADWLEGLMERALRERGRALMI